jgi:hypothetical protein
MEEPRTNPEDPVLRRNTAIYAVTIALAGLIFSWADAAALLPSLAMQIGAPDWLAVLPQVATLTIGNAAVLLVGWRLSERTPRRKAYAVTLLPMFLPMLLLPAALLLTEDRRWLVAALGAAVVLRGFGQGMSVLPYWELFARVFPERSRARTISHMSALRQVCVLAGALLAAWLISDRSPLAFPYNYALLLTLYVAGGLSVSVVALGLKEPPLPPAPEPPPPGFGEYLRRLGAIVRADADLRRLLGALMVAAALAGMPPLFLLYATHHRGFGQNDISLLVAVRPWVAVGTALALGWAAVRWGIPRCLAALALLAAAGAAATPLLWGAWQVLPQIALGFANHILSFGIVAVLNRRSDARPQDLLTVGHLALAGPSLAPLLLTFLLAWCPGAVIALAAAAGAGCAALMLAAGRGNGGAARDAGG